MVITGVKIAADCWENPAAIEADLFVIRYLDHFHQLNNATYVFQSKQMENLAQSEIL